MVLSSLFVAALAGVASAKCVPRPKLSDKIKNVVVLVEENRSFDTFAGGLNYTTDIDGLVHRNFCNSMNITDPNEKADVCSGPIAWDVASDDPNHSINGINLQLFGTYHPDEDAVASSPAETYQNMRGFVTTQAWGYKTFNESRAAEVMNYYPPEHIPVFSSIAENFVLFDRWFCSVPGPTNPNRAFVTSGTSYGWGTNDYAFTRYQLPVRSIYQALTEKNMTWKDYYNGTEVRRTDTAPYTWIRTSGLIDSNVRPLAEFFTDAAAGNLPQFTFIDPECCNYDSLHPPGAVHYGERFIKLIYEALRNSPQWNETLFIITFDEHGGFADHVPPPVNVPAPDNRVWTEKAADGRNITFKFNRLGPRVPTLLISPWVGKGVVEHKGRNKGGEYTHTSILGFLSELWGFDKFNPRIEWSATFEHLFLDTPRSDDDSPRVLPEPVQW